MSSNIISFRVPIDQYNQILIECDKQEIPITEWIQRKLAVAQNAKEMERQILRDLKFILRKWKFAFDPKPGLEKLEQLIEQLEG